MSDPLEKNSGTFLPIAICMAFIAMFVVGAVQSSIPATADTAIPEAALVDDLDGTSEARELEALPEAVVDDSDEILENGEEDVEAVAYVEGAPPSAVEGGDPPFSQC
jgi:hypothetical protein